MQHREHCPRCKSKSLKVVDVNCEAALNWTARAGLYEYRCDNAQCSLAFFPGIHWQRCFQCTQWVPGSRRNGAIVCEHCINKGYEYEDVDLRSSAYRNG